MPLSREFCFLTESEARCGLAEFAAESGPHTSQLLDTALSTAFLVRQELWTLARQRSGDIATRCSTTGLPDLCIPANEDHLVPALVSRGLACCMEVRDYSANKISANSPPVHAYTSIKLDNSELILDVDADPFYGENIGVVVTPYRTGLYSLGSLVHRRWVSEAERVNRFEFYTSESRLYLVGESVPQLSMRYYFLDSESNLCPIGLSPYTTAYFGYDRVWAGMRPHDAIRLILVSNRQDGEPIWNLIFNDLHYIEIAFNVHKGLFLRFRDDTEFVMPLDDYGYPVEHSAVRFVDYCLETDGMIRFSFDSAPIHRLQLPDPYRVCS